MEGFIEAHVTNEITLFFLAPVMYWLDPFLGVGDASLNKR
jgi:hypothetical protein